jgi:hypothetical protein
LEKRKHYAKKILVDMTHEEFQKIETSPVELKKLESLQIRASSYYRSQYEDGLKDFFTKWQEMKKLYVELIELYCKDIPIIEFRYTMQSIVYKKI